MNKKYKLENSEKGFTLVEYLVYMGVFSILLFVLMQIFLSILDVHAESQATSSISQDETYIVAKLSYDFLRATTVVSPSIGITASTMQIQGSSLDNTYKLTGGNLVVTDNLGATTDQLNGSNATVTSITFKTLANSVSGKSTMQVTFTLRSATLRRGQAQQKTFQTTIGRRI